MADSPAKATEYQECAKPLPPAADAIAGYGTEPDGQHIRSSSTRRLGRLMTGAGSQVLKVLVPLLCTPYPPRAWGGS